MTMANPQGGAPADAPQNPAEMRLYTGDSIFGRLLGHVVKGVGHIFGGFKNGVELLRPVARSIMPPIAVFHPDNNHTKFPNDNRHQPPQPPQPPHTQHHQGPPFGNPNPNHNQFQNRYPGASDQSGQHEGYPLQQQQHFSPPPGLAPPGFAPPGFPQQGVQSPFGGQPMFNGQ